MRRICRTDRIQSEIVSALRKHGASVQPIHQLGRGIPDLLVGYGGRNFLLELKDGSKPPSARRLTPDEREWHQQWKGQAAIVNSAEEAIKLIGLKSEPPHKLKAP